MLLRAHQVDLLYSPKARSSIGHLLAEMQLSGTLLPTEKINNAYRLHLWLVLAYSHCGHHHHHRHHLPRVRNLFAQAKHCALSCWEHVLSCSHISIHDRNVPQIIPYTHTFVSTGWKASKNSVRAPQRSAQHKYTLFACQPTQRIAHFNCRRYRSTIDWMLI